MEFNRLSLVGMSAAGKSSVAPFLAARMGWRQVDLDEEAERLAGTSADALIGAGGLALWRQAELAAFESLSSEASVVAIGAGAFDNKLFSKAFDQLNGKNAIAVWIDAPDEVLAERAAREKRPLFSGAPPLEVVSRQRESRSSAYELCSILRCGRWNLDPDARALGILKTIADLGWHPVGGWLGSPFGPSKLARSDI